MIEIPASHVDLLERPITVTLATVMASGQPQVHPVWCSYHDGYVLVNSAKGRAKDKNMRARPRVTVLAMEPDNPLRWLEVRGTVINVEEANAVAHLDDMSALYLNKHPYPWHVADEIRVLYTIEPTRVTPFGD